MTRSMLVAKYRRGAFPDQFKAGPVERNCRVAELLQQVNFRLPQRRTLILAVGCR